MRLKHVALGAVSAVALSALSTTAFAGPCGTSVLSDWLGSGFSCTVGDKTFSNFLYNPDGFNVPASSVGVTPVGDGLVFNGAWVNTDTVTHDAFIGFTVTAPDTNPITDAALTVSGILPGTVFTDVETLSNGTVLSATNADPGPITASFDPATTLTQTEDLVVLPGAEGNIVGLSLFTKTFSGGSTPPPTVRPPAVPEPGSLALLGSMLVGFGGIGWSRRRSS